MLADNFCTHSDYFSSKFHGRVQTDVLIEMDPLSLVIITGGRAVPAETTADDLADNLVHHKHQDGAQQDYPAHGEEEKAKHEQGFVTVGILLGVRELNL